MAARTRSARVLWRALWQVQALWARAAEEEGVTGGTFKEKLRRKNASLEQTGDDLGDDFDLSDDEDAGGDSEQSGSSYYSEDSDGEGTEESSGADEGGELSEGLEEEEEAEEEGAAEADEREKKRRRRDLNVTGEEAFLRRAGIQPGEGKQRGGEEAEELATTAQLDSSVPFVIETPTTYADFSELMTGRDPAQQAEILRRIRISNPVSLGQQNRKRAQAFFERACIFLVDLRAPAAASLPKSTVAVTAVTGTLAA